MLVTSGVPLASVLGPVLILIYNNDIDVGLNYFNCKYTDDTKIGNALVSECDRQSRHILQKVSDREVKNTNKDQILQVGSRNIKNDHEMCGVKVKSFLPVLASQSRLAITFPSSATSPLKKANRMMSLIFFFFKNKDVLPLYTTFVRPRLKYDVQFWSPYQCEINKSVGAYV